MTTRVKPGTGRVATADRRRLFAMFFVVHAGNIAKAALDAGYSPRTAYAQGSAVLKDPAVLELIEQFQGNKTRALVARAEVTEQMVVEELRHVAFSRIDQIIDWGLENIPGKGKKPNGRRAYVMPVADAKGLPDNVKAAIKEVRLTDRGISIKMHDKNKALVDLGKHLGMWPNSVILQARLTRKSAKAPLMDLKGLSEEELLQLEALLEKAQGLGVLIDGEAIDVTDGES